MKCENCGAEMPENQDVCSACGTQQNVKSEAETSPAEAVTESEAETAPAEAVAESEAEAAPAEAVAESEAETAPAQAPAQKKSNKVVIGAVAAVAVVAAGAFGIVKMNEKDPKQVVIDAFESVYKEDQVYPIDELLGVSEFAKTAGTVNSQVSMTLKMDSCSEESVNAYAGSGMRIAGKSDITNKKSSAELGVIYNGMDLVTMDMYYGEEMLKMAVPELSGRVFTLDLGDGLAERISDSPIIGPMLEQNNIDVEGMAAYFSELMEEAEKNQAEGKSGYDLEGLWNRYKEGCKAQDNFKAALTVAKAGKANYTVDGQEVSCKGYTVNISKASMMDFLRTSSDFFLQDEELKNQYLKQLEMTVKMSEMMGATYGGAMLSAEELQQQSYEELQSSVNEMLDILDASLDDVNMTVYVDKKGRLAAVDGTTKIHHQEDAADMVNVEFDLQLTGGAYLTQNAAGNVTVSDPEDVASYISLDFVKQGTYDGKVLTADWSVEGTSMPENEKASLMYTGSYNSDGGDYHVSLEVGNGDSQLALISATGAIDTLEKGTSLHANLDELKVSIMDGSSWMILSGDYEYKPLEGEVTAPEGEELDAFAATQEDWQAVMMEMIFGAMSLMEQMGVSLY